MDLKQAIYKRHSVRAYLDRPIDEETKKKIISAVEEINAESGLHIQFVTDEKKAFDGFMAHYGSFSGVSNYFALVGKNDRDLDEKCGYYGQKLVLLCQSLGLNSCWVALTFKKVKDAYRVETGEKLCLVIAVGYGKTQGTQHKNKPVEKLSDLIDGDPDWYKNGVEGAMSAPTAINQQKFYISRNGEKVTIKSLVGPCAKIDLGIVKCNFEIAAGKENFSYND